MKYRFLIFSFISICTFSAVSQDWVLPLTGKVEKAGKKLQGAIVTLMQGSKQVAQTMTGDDGAFKFDIPPNGEFMVLVTKSGLCTKKFQISTRGVPPNEKDDGTKRFDIPGISLFELIPGVDYSVLNQPLVKIQYDALKQNFGYDENYFTQSLEALDRLKKLEADAVNKQKELELNYQTAIKNGDKAFQKKDWNTAKSSYSKASVLKPAENYPKEQLAQIEIILKDQEALNKKAEAEKAAAADKAAADKLAAEKAAADKLAAEKAAAEKAAADKLAKDKAAAEKAAADKLAAEKAAADKLAAEKAAAEKAASDKLAKDKAAAEKAAADKLAAEKAAADKLAKDKAAAEKAAADKLAAEKAAADKLAAEKAAAEKAAADKLAKDKAAAEKAAADKLAKDKAAAEKAAADKLAAEKAAAEKAAAEKAAAEKAAADKLAKDKAAADKLAAEKAAADKLAKDKAAADKAAADKLAAEKAAADKVAADKLAADKLAKDKAAADKAAAEKTNISKAEFEKYKNIIAKADGFFNNKQYPEAKKSYQEALIAKANDSYARGKLIEIEKILNSDNSSVNSVDDKMKALRAKYKLGVTEETIIGQGVVIIQRVVVKESSAYVYQKKLFSWGGSAFFRDDEPITEITFNEETKK